MTERSSRVMYDNTSSEGTAKAEAEGRHGNTLNERTTKWTGEPWKSMTCKKIIYLFLKQLPL